MYQRIAKTNAPAESEMNYLGFHLLDFCKIEQFLRNMFSKLVLFCSAIYFNLFPVLDS